VGEQRGAEDAERREPCEEDQRREHRHHGTRPDARRGDDEPHALEERAGAGEGIHWNRSGPRRQRVEHRADGGVDVQGGRVGSRDEAVGDGDVAGVIHCAEAKTGIDIYLGIGGAPEGVLSAAALRCIGGQMQTRLIIDTEALRERTLQMGIKDAKKKYHIEDMVKGDCLFSATGVTTGVMLSGVKFGKDVIETETVVMRSATGTVRRVLAEHRQFAKFHLG